MWESEKSSERLERLEEERRSLSGGKEIVRAVTPEEKGRSGEVQVGASGDFGAMSRNC